MGKKKEVCYKCRWLILVPDGFFRRKSKNGPCDKCLGQMTTFQVAWEQDIWLKYIPPKPKTEVQPQKPVDRGTLGSTPSPHLGSTEKNIAANESSTPAPSQSENSAGQS